MFPNMNPTVKKVLYSAGIFVVVLILIFVLSILSSCAPAKFTPAPTPKVEFTPTEPYTIDLSNIPKPEMLKPIFMDKDFKETTPDKAVYIVLVPKEYNKIAHLLKLCKAYKEIIKEQEFLVNTHISINNALKEYLELEIQKTESYKALWADSENMYRQERYYHKLDNAVNRGALGVISVGSIIAILLLL